LVKRSIKTILIILTLSLSIYNFNLIQNRGNVTIDFVNVGQGDSALISSANGRHMLIDAGKADSKTKENISSIAYMRSIGVKKIDILSLSHYDDDHSGAAEAISELFDIEMLFVPEPKDDKDIIAFSQIAKALPDETNVFFPETNDEVKIGEDITIKVLSINNDGKESNDRSLILRIDAFDNSAIFTGDMDLKMEKNLLGARTKEELDIDIAKVGHHGSKNASSAEFYKALTPIYSIISVGKNSYGHPTDEAMNNILASGSKIYRTDKDGGVRFIISKTGIKEKKI